LTGETTNAETTAAAVPLKDPALAALLAWLVPGLGHLYQGRLAKAVLFFVCIMGTFVYGLYLGSGPEVGWGRVVYASWRPEDKRLYYFCQIGVGLPAMPALVQAIRVRHGKEPLGKFMAPPAVGNRDAADGRETLDMIHRRLARYFELGTIYTSVAGLLNLLAIFVLLAGPVVVASRDEDNDEEDCGDSAEQPAEQPSESKDTETDATLPAEANS